MRRRISEGCSNDTFSSNIHVNPLRNPDTPHGQISLERSANTRLRAHHLRMRDLGRARADMWEVAYWEDMLSVEDGEVNMVYQVHNESVVVPGNVDAIRALKGWKTIGKNL